ncbi:signal transduction histidine kinase [Thermodesulfitimonas autotrophica]|uniref:histidine kinase n=1 Tax=Thermodesulfitimonas autotrophica TaxID=1894989 RepID=A0A3N5ATL3_9THEO|nr:HAMP domain-containing sensor histidine kinase [Thermodesulfitimonas autotrophica]RPF46980.1 signal transduction histidine kinase [Thermodesulfitimonas autotrophica]
MNRIFSKMMVLNLAIVLFTALALSLLLSFLFTRYFYREYGRNLEEALQEATVLAAKHFAGRTSRSGFERGLKLIDRLEGVHFWLLDPQGRLLFTTAPDLEIFPKPGFADQVIACLRQGRMYARVLTDPKDPSLDLMVAATSLPEGALVGFFPVADVKEPLKESIGLVWLAAVGAFALGAVPTYFVARHFSYPLVLLSRVARRMGQGDFGARVELKRRDEIGDLAAAFNAMAQQLESLDKERQAFLANVSHELRTPLTSIRGFIQGILDGTIAPPDQPAYLARVFGEVGRLSGIVDELLTLARLRGGRLRFHWERLNPTAVLDAVVEMLTPLAAEKKVKIDFAAVGDQRELWADRGRLAQIFTNILDNAVKFSPEGGKVEVNACWDAQGWRVTIGDEGPGIPPGDIPYIFDRFYTGSLSARESPGTGLGLAISKLLVEEHGGTISVRNRPRGGCEFTVFLPAAFEPSCPASRGKGEIGGEGK